ncbi:NADP-dependent 3-hydroxy acid dehydrogenase YdfG [Faunimonas pinastri]|uniref:NADP-dependent 3-hydroxy acid dehydrogenase YdfG n=1 Tax=Faunimonas pinastri TaxID=1855383 RepID=A0A1H8ZYL6_9HYPH|nr:SDR family oxidoreductase [Faunimonas pinastri]SEP69435.1 NADP-dependent 3-hydroxy acid dehydrogenase YdfG [Faunimonas pinastri]
MAKVVVITGASAGVGRAVAARFARDGASIGLIARGPERLEAAAEEVRHIGGQALALPLDVADHDQVEAAATRVEEEFGPIDIWINGAMATLLGPLHEMSPEEFRRITEVTYLGNVHGTMAALKRMRVRDRGTIVQIGSALAYRSIPLQSAYCGAKHAIVGYTDSLRSELIHDGSRVRLTVVHLPAVNTPQFEWARNKMPFRQQPVPPIYQPEVAASGIHYAALHPGRREYWIGSSSYQAILGQKVAPGLLDRMMAKKGYSGQMTSEPETPRGDNLFAPVPGDFGARGRFGNRARSFSPALFLSEHPRSTLGSVTVAGAGFLGWLIGRLLLSRKKPAPPPKLTAREIRQQLRRARRL